MKKLLSILLLLSFNFSFAGGTVNDEGEPRFYGLSVEYLRFVSHLSDYYKPAPVFAFDMKVNNWEFSGGFGVVEPRSTVIKNSYYWSSSKPVDASVSTMYIIPFYASYDWLLSDNFAVKPYLGVGVGLIYYTMNYTTTGSLSGGTTSAMMGIAPRFALKYDLGFGRVEVYARTFAGFDIEFGGDLTGAFGLAYHHYY